jgi:hypothetical protein
MTRHLYGPMATLLAVATLAFVVSPAAQQPSFRFGAAGDFSYNDDFKAVVAAVKRSNPEIFFALGDLSYGDGEKRWCEHWTQVAQYRNVLIVSGNHDSGESLGGDINKYVQYCNPLGLPINNGTTRYGKQYVVDYPRVSPLARFIMVVPGVRGNRLGFDNKYTRGSPGYAFVGSAIDEARQRQIPWVIVGMHKNYISALEKENEVSTDEERSFMTMLLDKRVDLILQGHEHGYERTKQLATKPQVCTVLPVDLYRDACVADHDNTMVKGAGSVIHVLGTGGKGLRGLNVNDSEYRYFAKADNRTFGFGEFTVSRTSLSFVFRATNKGGLQDSFTIAQ